MKSDRTTRARSPQTTKSATVEHILQTLPDFPLVSFVIPMYNEEKNIRKCLDSILAQTYPIEKIEINVVDGNSTDRSRQIVEGYRARHHNIRLLENPSRKTPKGLNVGARHASGDVIIILGAHTRVKSDFVEQNIRTMKAQKVLCVGGTQINTGDTYIQRAIGKAMGSPFGIMSAPYRYRRRANFVDTVVYAAYHRSLFDQIGYFDEEKIIAEDAEFNWRIRKAGYKIFFTPKIVSYYFPRANLRKLVKQFFRYGILRVNVVKKHLDAIKILHMIPAAFVLFLVLSGLLTLIRPNVAPIFWGLLLLYGAFLIVASLYTGIRYGFKYLPVLPFVFAAMQLSFGAGFLVGIFKSHE